MNKAKNTVQISYFSDILCVWAYLSQIRLDELKKKFGKNVEIKYYFITLFGCTQAHIGDRWREKGGYDGFCRHVLDVCEDFPHVKVSPDIWKSCRPFSSGLGHLFLKAVQNIESLEIISKEEVADFKNKTIFEELAWRVRVSFFEKAIDIGQISNLYEIAEQMNLPISEIEKQINNGEAMAALCADMAKKEINKLEGSPTYLLNQGRQKLYGNVGYRVLEANVMELMERKSDIASWC